jgi:hypothetical protein
MLRFVLAKSRDTQDDAICVDSLLIWGGLRCGGHLGRLLSPQDL